MNEIKNENPAIELAIFHLSNAAHHIQQAEHALDAAARAIGNEQPKTATRKVMVWQGRLWKTRCSIESLAKGLEQ